MYVLDMKEQSVRAKKFLSAPWNFAQKECAPLILTEGLIKNEWKEIYSLYEKDT